jgi:hypothetical protein
MVLKKSFGNIKITMPRRTTEAAAVAAAKTAPDTEKCSALGVRYTIQASTLRLTYFSA